MAPRAKKAAETVVEAAAQVEEKVVAAAKKAAAPRKPRAPKAAAPAIYVQYMGGETDVNALVEAAKASFKAGNDAAITELKLYIKPEESAAYYVINGDCDGKIDL